MNSSRDRQRLLVLAIGLLALSSSALPARAATETVDEIGSSFQPAQVDIAVNDRVVWTNRSSQPHTVTFERGPDLHPNCDPTALLRFGCQTPGEAAERTFTNPGTYPYYCKIHRAQGMAGVVVVSAATSTTGSTTSSTLARATTTSSTVRASTSSTTATTRPLATSSTIAISSTTSTTMDSSSVLLPGDPPTFTGDDTNSSAAGRSGGSDEGSDTGTVALIVALLLGVSAAGGYILWRLRPGRA